MASQRDNPALYEQEILWNRDYLEDPYYRTKVRLLQGMIPDEVRTILDVGCGNGAITNALLSTYWVVGGDRTHTALKHLKTYGVQLTADHLPFKNHAFDLVMSHQMLEHLPDAIFQYALCELMRISRRYLLVSVPYRERLAEQYAHCQNCGCTYHVWGHLQAFKGVIELRRLFPTFILRVHAFCGRENEYRTRPGLWISQRIGGAWTIDSTGICPQCGSSDQYLATLPRRAIAAIANRIDRLIPKKKAFWWLICLFEREQTRNGVFKL